MADLSGFDHEHRFAVRLACGLHVDHAECFRAGLAGLWSAPICNQHTRGDGEAGTGADALAGSVPHSHSKRARPSLR
jgi:hypothetical protein